MTRPHLRFISRFMTALLAFSAFAIPQDEKTAGKRDQLQIGIGTKPFDVSRRSIDLDEIQKGGPPRDGIPALVDPKFVTASEAGRFLRDKDEVLGVVENGVAKAYPLKILEHHEVVNDRVGGKSVAVTY